MYDCQSCGACCGSVLVKLGHWVNCTDLDVMSMPKRHRLKLFAVKDEDGRKLKATPQGKDGYCTFLTGTPGDKVSCRIYKHRPTLCRVFKAGSENCRSSRAEIGLPT